MLLNELGSLLLAEGKAAEARPFFERALGVEPKNPRARLGLAQSLGEMGDPERALAALDEARALEVLHPGLEVYRAIVLARLGRSGEAVEVLEGVLARNPEAPEAQRQLGLLLAPSRPRDALTHLTAAFRALPEDEAALTTAGLLAYSLNQDSDAADFLERALARDPTNVEARTTLGKLFFRRIDYEDARHAFERALEDDPGSEEAHFYLGEIERASQRFEEAAHHFQKAGSAEARKRLGEALLKMRSYDEAETAFEEALALETESRARAETLYLLGSLRSEQSDDDGAVALLTEASKSNPYHAGVRYLLGTVLARLGRGEEARKELETFRSLKAFEEKKGKLELAILEHPAEASSYRPLIELYLEHGRGAEALAFLEKALALAPEDRALLELKARFHDGEPRC